MDNNETLNDEMDNKSDTGDVDNDFDPLESTSDLIGDLLNKKKQPSDLPKIGTEFTDADFDSEDDEDDPFEDDDDNDDPFENDDEEINAVLKQADKITGKPEGTSIYRRGSSNSSTIRSPKAGFRRNESIKTIKRSIVKTTGLRLLNVTINSSSPRNINSAPTKNLRDTSKSPVFSKNRMEKLSTPKSQKKNKHRTFSNEDDELNCTFKPPKHTKQNSEYENNSSKSDFLKRTEALELNRRKKIEYTRGEEAYEIRLDKKECHTCGAVQSYAEFRDKKKKCPNCQTEFRSKNTWGNVREEFLSRMEEEEARLAKSKARIRSRVEHEEKNGGKLGKSRQQRYYDKALSKKTENGASDFMTRLKLDNEKRQIGKNVKRTPRRKRNIQV